jgi:hypothetical protein
LMASFWSEQAPDERTMRSEAEAAATARVPVLGEGVIRGLRTNRSP